MLPLDCDDFFYSNVEVYADSDDDFEPYDMIVVERDGSV